MDPRRSVRARDDRRLHPARPVLDVRAPSMPRLAPDGQPWRPETRAWWRTWKRSPVARTFTETDWQFVRATLVLVDDLWRGNPGVAGELRRREEKLATRNVAAADVAAPAGVGEIRMFDAEAV